MVAAAADRDLDAVRALAASGVSVNARNLKGRMPLRLAAGFDRTEVVEWLVSEGADVNRTGGFGWSPLTWAASQGARRTALALLTGDVKAVRLLLHHGAAVASVPEGRYFVRQQSRDLLREFVGPDRTGSGPSAPG